MGKYGSFSCVRGCRGGGVRAGKQAQVLGLPSCSGDANPLSSGYFRGKTPFFLQNYRDEINIQIRSFCSLLTKI